MKKENRIKDSLEFQAIINNRRFFTSRNFVVYIKDKIEDNTRIGISVPKRLGNAVLRNKTKRQVREMLRKFYNANMPYDYVIIVRNDYFNNSFKDNLKDLEKLVKTAKM